MKIKAWVGFSDGKPMVWRDADRYGERNKVDVYSNRDDARKAYSDYRRCTIIVDDEPKRIPRERPRS